MERSPGEAACSIVETCTDSLEEGGVKERKGVGRVHRHCEGGEGKKGLNFMGVKPASDMELGALFFLDLEKYGGNTSCGPPNSTLGEPVLIIFWDTHVSFGG